MPRSDRASGGQGSTDSKLVAMFARGLSRVRRLRREICR